MKCRSLFVLSAILFGLGCGDDRNPTGLRAPTGPSEIINDGARGGNPDFFFLPPMVPPPFQHPEFDRGQFNPRLQASLKIEICALDPAYLSAEGKPLTTTPCLSPLVKTFAPGSVDLVGVPSEQSGWWSNFNLPSDGFYKVLWDTRQHALDPTMYYRIRVLIHGSDEELGFADLDPVSNMREWRHAVTGEVVTMIEDTKLPIPFRVETGALCGEATQCGSATITNDNPNGDTQVLQVLNEDGLPVAGVLVPDGWLPPDGPQSVVFNIERVNTGTSNVAAGTQQVPCHANVQLQQFDACFHFSTIPELPILDEETGRQFAKSIVGAVCFVLADSDDPRVPWVQLWSSEPDEENDQPIPLKSADASGILTDHDGHNCRSDETIVTDSRSNVLTRFASIGWQKFTRGMGGVFGVKTAYAVDLGLGGILDGISNIGPAMRAEIRAVTSTNQTVPAGTSSITVTARIVGTKIHDGNPLGEVEGTSKTRGIPGVPVTFSMGTEGNNGGLTPFAAEGEATPVAQLTATTSEVLPGNDLSGGLASVIWNLPAAPGTYTLRATGQAEGTVTYTVTVLGAADITISSALTLNPSAVGTSGGSVTLSGWTITNAGGAFTLEGLVDNGFYLSTDPIITTSDTKIGSNHNSTELQSAGGSFNWGGPTFAIPALAAGTYYIGILVDESNHVAESNEGNNYVSAPLVVLPDFTGSWTTKASMPGPVFLNTRSAALSNGKIYTMGPQFFSPYTVRINEYDPATNTWVERGSLLRPRDKFSVAVVNDVIYVIGGQVPALGDPILEVEAYDPSTGVSTDVTTIPVNQLESSAGVINGIVYVVGGYTMGANRSVTMTSIVQAYNPATNSWSQKKPLPTTRHSLGVATVGGLLYAVGGYEFFAQTRSTVEAYDPATDTWTAKRSLQVPRTHGGVVAFGGRIYAVGGWNHLGPQGSNWLSSVEVYEPAFNAWISVNPLNQVRGEFGLSASNGSLYAIAGRNATSWVNTVVAFDP